MNLFQIIYKVKTNKQVYKLLSGHGTRVFYR